MPNLVNIRTFMYRHEAGLAKGLLDEEGIKSVISADDMGGFRPHLALGMGRVQLKVSNEDAEKAREILKVLGDESN